MVIASILLPLYRCVIKICVVFFCSFYFNLKIYFHLSRLSFYKLRKYHGCLEVDVRDERLWNEGDEFSCLYLFASLSCWGSEGYMSCSSLVWIILMQILNNKCTFFLVLNCVVSNTCERGYSYTVLQRDFYYGLEGFPMCQIIK